MAKQKPATPSSVVDPQRSSLVGTDRFDAAAQALAVTEVDKIPTHTQPRLAHFDGLVATVGRDRAMLVKVPLEDGALTPWELDELAPAVAQVRQSSAEVGADALSASALSAADKKLLTAVRADQKLLLSAFRRLRFKGRTAELKRLRAIEAGDAEDVIDARNDSAALVALADHDEHRAWVATLPLGESDAVARLKAAQGKLEALASAAQTSASATGRRDLLMRRWTVLARVERRIRAAGTYLFHGKPERADYAAFKDPPSRKRKRG